MTRNGPAEGEHPMVGDQVLTIDCLLRSLFGAYPRSRAQRLQQQPTSHEPRKAKAGGGFKPWDYCALKNSCRIRCLRPENVRSQLPSLRQPIPGPCRASRERTPCPPAPRREFLSPGPASSTCFEVVESFVILCIEWGGRTPRGSCKIQLPDNVYKLWRSEVAYARNEL